MKWYYSVLMNLIAKAKMMAKIDKLKVKLKKGSRLSFSEVRTLLKDLGYQLKRQRGSHEQWVKGGKTFTLPFHGKDVPHYILDSLNRLLEVNDD